MAIAVLSKHKSKIRRGERIKLPTLGRNLSEAQAREIYRRGEEATVFALLELAQHWGGSEQPTPTPATPSAMIPTFQKPAASAENVRDESRATPALPAWSVRNPLFSKNIARTCVPTAVDR